jgi:heavy metal translocating P-type ATPase
MFIEACIVSAGIHYGGKLFKKIKTDFYDKKDKISESSLPANQFVKNIIIKQVPENEQTENEQTDDEKAIINSHLTMSFTAFGLTAAGALFAPPLTFVGLVMMLRSNVFIFKKALHAIFKEKRSRIEIFDAIAILTSLISGYYVISALLDTLYFGAQKLRLKTESDVKRKIFNIFAEYPKSVWILKDGTEVNIAFESLQVSDIVIVNAGEIIPADGEIVGGSANIQQSMLTGEGYPVEKETKDKVFAGTILISGRIHIRSEQTGANTVSAKIGKILQNTAEFTKNIESDGQAIADKSVIPSLFLSVGAFPFIGQTRTVALLCSNYLANMRVTAPLGMLNFLSMASEQGILIKDGRSFQLLSQIDTVIFDKTGTLTLEKPKVANIYTSNNIERDKVLELAAAAEYRQTHPIAQSILEEAEHRKIEIPQIDEATYKIGYGITVRLNNDCLVKVGSKRFMTAERIDIPDYYSQIEKNIYSKSNSSIYVAYDNILAGMIELEPSIRPEAEGIIKKLKSLGMKLYILSGDHENPSKTMAEKLGFDGWFAEALPEDKADIIDKFRKEGKKICFIGDGINDAIALKKANVSVSMKGASTAATDSAQIVLMDESLKNISWLFDIANSFQDNMKDTFFAVAAPSIFCIGGVLFAHFTILGATLLYGVSLASGMAAVSLPVVKNKPTPDKQQNSTES